MGCMSIDIFRCLSTACITVNTYSASKYIKYLLAAWVAPMPLPLRANVLTVVGFSKLAYSTSGLCWMANSQGVLYLFPIPVLTSVGANIFLFIGSVHRLCPLMKNASFIGRKEDSKHRLVQCFNVSSWMGLSWFFSIIPNITGMNAFLVRICPNQCFARSTHFLCVWFRGKGSRFDQGELSR